MNDIIDNIRVELRKAGDQKTQKSSQRFFNDAIKSYGVKAPLVHQISKDYFQLIASKTKPEVFDICESLWQSGYIEESIVACRWSYRTRKKYDPGDFEIFERWINAYVDNWAACDTLCNHSLGAFIEMYPEYLERLKVLAKSDNRWARRASAVSLIVPARKGKFLTEILEIADILLVDTDDLVQKGYGWMLKAASKEHQREIFDYVLKNKTIMPRTALRYAIEKMPGELKRKAMEK